MAKGTISGKTTKIGLRQEIETDKFSTQTLSHWNPSITDDKAYYFGNQLMSMSSKSGSAIYRTDNYDIAYE